MELNLSVLSSVSVLRCCTVRTREWVMLWQNITRQSNLGIPASELRRSNLWILLCSGTGNNSASLSHGKMSFRCKILPELIFADSTHTELLILAHFSNNIVLTIHQCLKQSHAVFLCLVSWGHHSTTTASQLCCMSTYTGSFFYATCIWSWERGNSRIERDASLSSRTI